MIITFWGIDAQVFMMAGALALVIYFMWWRL